MEEIEKPVVRELAGEIAHLSETSILTCCCSTEG